jgi:hypothetical protein
MAWVGIQQDLDNGLLSHLIDFADEIVLALGAHGKAIDILTASVNDGASAPGGLDRRVEHRVHDCVKSKSD